MKNFWQCMIIMTLFMLAVLAVIETDRRCADMYGKGGSISAAAVSAVMSVREPFDQGE